MISSLNSVASGRLTKIAVDRNLLPLLFDSGGLGQDGIIIGGTTRRHLYTKQIPSIFVVRCDTLSSVLSRLVLDYLRPAMEPLSGTAAYPVSPGSRKFTFAQNPAPADAKSTIYSSRIKEERKPLAIAIGDPDGVGPEILARSLEHLPSVRPLLSTAMRRSYDWHVNRFGVDTPICCIESPDRPESGALNLISPGLLSWKQIRPGELTVEAGRASLEYVRLAGEDGAGKNCGNNDPAGEQGGNPTDQF